MGGIVSAGIESGGGAASEENVEDGFGPGY